MLLMAGFGWKKPTPVVPSKLRGGVFGPGGRRPRRARL